MDSLKRIAIWAVIGTLARTAFVWWANTAKKNEQEAAARAQARKERATRLLHTSKAETRVFDMPQGQLLVIDMPLQTPEVGDVVAVFGTGAYCYTMASNYNGQPRPGIVFVKDGQARVVTRRETYADLYHRDI